MAATPTGHGYWLVASDGGIFTFGDAALPRLDRRARTRPARSSAWPRPPTGNGYWLVAPTAASSVRAAARFLGSGGAQALLSPTVVMAAAPGGGYWLGTEDGGIYTATAGGQWLPDPHDGGHA